MYFLTVQIIEYLRFKLANLYFNRNNVIFFTATLNIIQISTVITPFLLQFIFQNININRNLYQHAQIRCVLNYTANGIFSIISHIKNNPYHNFIFSSLVITALPLLPIKGIPP